MDTEYILSSAADLGEITPLELATLSHPAGYNVVRYAVDNNLPMPQHYLENTARTVYEAHPVDVRHYLALRSAPETPLLLKSIEDRANSIVQRVVQQQLGVVQPNRNYNQLLGIAEATPVVVQREEDITEQAVCAILETEFGAFRERLVRNMQALADAIAWQQQDGGKRFAELRTKVEDAPRETEAAMHLKAMLKNCQPKFDKKKLSIKKAARSAIKKATRLFTRTGLEPELRLMVTGQEVTIAHDESNFKFVIKPYAAGWLEQKTEKVGLTAPFEIMLLTKQDVSLARLCVYMKDTPVLDQLLALTMFVRTGNELMLLEEANWFGVKPHTKEIVTQTHPQLEHKFSSFCADRLRQAVQRMHPEHEHWDRHRASVSSWVAQWMAPVTTPYQHLIAAYAQLGYEQPVPVAARLEVEDTLDALMLADLRDALVA